MICLFLDKRLHTGGAMSGFDQMSEERFNALGTAILMFFLTEPSPVIMGHQVDAQFTKLCPLLIGLSQRFQALMSEHGLVIADTICVTPAELQHFSDELHRRLGEDRRMYQSKPVIHPARPLV